MHSNDEKILIRDSLYIMRNSHGVEHLVLKFPCPWTIDDCPRIGLSQAIKSTYLILPH